MAFLPDPQDLFHNGPNPLAPNPFDKPITQPPKNPFDFGSNPGFGAQDPGTITQRNQQDYEFIVAVQNFSDEYAKVKPEERSWRTAKQVNPMTIANLVINESFHDWNTTGYIEVLSPAEGFERTAEDLHETRAYTMRMDCRDLLFISVMPVSDPKIKGYDPKNTFPIAQYMLRGEFVIYDSEDIATGHVIMKVKRFYFRDLRYQLMSEQRIQFSTNDVKYFPTADPDGRLDNEVPTGTVLRTLLDVCNDSTLGLEWGKIMEVSTQNWDEGNEKIFFTAPANYSILDSVNYILDRHVSKAGTAVGTGSAIPGVGHEPGAFTGEANPIFTFNGVEYTKSQDPGRPGFIIMSGPDSGKSILTIPGYTGTPPTAAATHDPSGGTAVGSDLCIFTTDRFTKEFELIPLSKLFELSTDGSNPGKYQIEHFFIPTVSELNTGTGSPGRGKFIRGEVPGLTRAPMTMSNDWILDTKLANFGFINHYRFVDFSGADNAKAIVTRPVFSYDFKLHQFQCEYKQHNIETTKKFFTSNYTDKMYGGVGNKPVPLLTLNKLKKKQKVLEPVFSTKKIESRCNDGRNQTLYFSVFLNEHIMFTTLGSTNRTTGRFIGLDRDVPGSQDNNFDHRLLGQWLVVGVSHIFTQDAYINEIEAVKIQSFKDIKINEDIP